MQIGLATGSHANLPPSSPDTPSLDVGPTSGTVGWQAGEMFRTAPAVSAAAAAGVVVFVAFATLASCTSVPGRPHGGGPSDAGQAASGPHGPAGQTGSTGSTTGTTAPPTAAATPTAQPTRSGTRPVVVLDPGHNGGNATHPDQLVRQVPAGFGRFKDCNTVGTETTDGYPEHAFTLDVAMRVRELLTDQGFDVRLTRPNDTGVGPCVNERAATGNRAHAAAVVSIHGDGSLVGHGFHVIEADQPPAGAQTAAASHRLAEAVHQAYLTGSGLVPATYIGRDGYDLRSDLAGLNLSTRPTIMIECGNMRDPGDARLMRSPTGRQRIATAIAEGIENYLRPR